MQVLLVEEGLGGVEVGTVDGVTDTFSSITFSNSYTASPCLLADINTTNGGDTANLRWKSKTTSSVRVQVDEEQSRDSETKHTGEKVIYFAVWSLPPVIVPLIRPRLCLLWMIWLIFQFNPPMTPNVMGTMPPSRSPLPVRVSCTNGRMTAEVLLPP